MSNENDEIEETTATPNSEQESSDEVEIDEASVDGSTYQSFRSEEYKYKFHPYHEYEEFDERWRDNSSQASSSRSSVSSFSVNQQQMHISMGSPGKKWVKKLLPAMGLKYLNIFNRSAPTFREFTNQELVQATNNYSEAPASREFTKQELEQATNNYSEDRILAKRRSRTVHMGILADKTIVAVKKCWSSDAYTSKDFENEKFILSRINHVNVAKLLGWCVEVESTILVLEYYPNGTFSELIQQGRDFNTRLRVATEAAQALVFLHYEASSPIIHRDVKSSNILLNAKHEVKVSDFGYSRILVSNDSLTWKFGERKWTLDELVKMDVFDFGMVLLELLTRKTSVKDFYACLRENRLLDILDPNITTYGLTEQLLSVAKLAARCMRGTLVKRPTMKEVHMELEASQTLNTTHPSVTDITDDSQDMMRDNTDDDTMETVPVGLWRSENSECFSDGIKMKQVLISCSSCPDGKSNSANHSEDGEDEGDRYEVLRKGQLRHELHDYHFFHRVSCEYKYCGIKRIFVGHNRGISYLSVEYVKDGQLQMSSIFGRNDLADTFTEVIILDYPNEFLQTVTGSYFVTFYDYIMCISSLTFHSNLRKYGPFGYDCGQHFEASGGKIVGFEGKESQLNCLQAIGFYMGQEYHELKVQLLMVTKIPQYKWVKVVRDATIIIS